MFLLLLGLFSVVQASHLQVVGNLAMVASHTGHVSYKNKELNVHVGKLWQVPKKKSIFFRCGVQNLGEDVSVAYGHFIRYRDGKV